MAKHLTADLDDMVFEHRERNYGAYFLRKRYPANLSVALGLVVFFALLGEFGPLIGKSMGWMKAKAKVVEHEVIIKLEDIPKLPPKEEELKIITPPPLPKVIVELHDYRLPVPVPEDEIDPEDSQTIEKVEDLIGENLAFFDQKGEDIAVIFDPGTGNEVPEVIVDTDPSPTVFTHAEELPKPVNIKDITKLIGYPQVARDAGIEGRVILRILVDKNGKYKKHIMANAVHPILSEAVEKHIPKLMFTPAIQGGRPIKFWVNIPFNFEIID